MCKMTIGDWIQVVIAFLILLTIIISTINVCLQRKYIRVVTRPWIYFDLKNKVQCNNVNKEVLIQAEFNNMGASPGLECRLFMIFTSDDKCPKEPPSSELKNVPKWAVVFPQQKTGIYNVPLFVELETEDQDAVQNAIAIRMSYLHTFLTYKSEDGKRFHLKQTFHIDNYELENDNMIVAWGYIRGDTKLL